MTCRLCKNHGVTTPLRGHKNNCPYRGCSCLTCKTTQMRKAEVRLNRANVREVLQQFENGTNDRESDEYQKVLAWINGEEIQDESVGEQVLIC